MPFELARAFCQPAIHFVALHDGKWLLVAVPCANIEVILGEEMRYTDRAWMLGRVLFGLFFLYAALMVIVVFKGMNPPETAMAASDFARALDRTGFMNPLIIGSMLVAGTALLFKRTAPLGLILLAPSIVVIACFHWFLTGKYVWGAIWPIWFALLVWHFRHVFARLWAQTVRD